MRHGEDKTGADKRMRLLTAAREAFMEEGYRASVDGIAARAGVAKQTLYNHFSNKEDLFIEVINQGSASVVVSLGETGSGLRNSLLQFAATFRQRALESESTALMRILTAEINRLPELTREFFAKGPGQTQARLAEFLSGAMTRGEMRQDDPRFAADMLMGMLLNIDFARCQCAISMDEEGEDQRCEQIVECFLRAFAPQA
ncbi:MAG: Fatty acid metabolism regulator protein [Betaproteobacteria bacterium ADurb.Bin341]|nr:MAG: Fatty acid metabolism regulator protein [Betaproteobacteria bacterium ADurb.Bin341]